MPHSGRPALSVILATTGRFASVRATVRHLQRQTVSDQIELIILTPEADNFGLSADETSRFQGFQLIKLERVVPPAVANATGVCHAHALVVVLAEDHSFPKSDWAEALIARHKENWAAVGPVVKNGNPDTATSWADYLLGYGPWHENQTSGPVRMLPGHNSSYKRDVLLRYEDKLADLLQAESVLHQIMIENGERLFLENRAVTSHLGFSRLRSLLPAQWWHARQYAASRSRSWRWWKRAIYFLGAPAIPVVRFVRIVRSDFRFPRRPAHWQILLVLCADLLADTAGQAAGYLFGTGAAGKFLVKYEYDRSRHITANDALALASSND